MIRGKLLRLGRVVLDGLDITLDVPPAPDRPVAWSGSFNLPATMTTPEKGGAYQLVLEDGRAGQLIVERVEGTGGQLSTFFRGTSPLK
jgi:hypothetical protein